MTNAIGNNFLSLICSSRISGVKPVSSEHTGGNASASTSQNVNLESKIGLGPCYSHIPGEGYKLAAQKIDYGA